MDAKLLNKLMAIQENIVAEKKLKEQIKKSKKDGTRVVVFKTESNKLGAIIPSNMKICGLNRFATEHVEEIEEFKNNEEKLLKL